MKNLSPKYRDYSKGKIYKITSLEDPPYFYIGSTTLDVLDRLKWHKNSFNNKKPVTKAIKYFIDINWHVEICVIEHCSVNSFTELRAIEDKYILENINNALCLNTNRAYISPEEEKRLQKIRDHNYRLTHLEQIKARIHKYGIEHKDQISQQKKEYYAKKHRNN